MNLDHCHDPLKEVRNWRAVAARKLEETGISHALIFSVGVRSDSENVFYKDDFPATPEGDKLLSESIQMTAEQHNYLNLFWVSNAYLEAIGTDQEAAYRKEFEMRAAQAERNEYAEVVNSSRNRKNAKGTRQNTLKDRYIEEGLKLISEGEKPVHKKIMNALENQNDVTSDGRHISIKCGKTVSIETCKGWLKEFNKKS